MKPTTFRAFLYSVPLFLTPFVDKVGDLMLNDSWPSPQKLVLCTLIGLINTAIGLRAYFDGSAERQKQKDFQDSAKASANPPPEETSPEKTETKET